MRWHGRHPSRGQGRRLGTSLNLDRVRQELPADTARWLVGAPKELWDPIDREVARRTLRALLADYGDAGDDDFARDRLRFTGSPAIKALVPALPWERWTARTLTPYVADYFGIATGRDQLRRGVTSTPNSQDHDHAA